jgi:glutamine amidotransferase-like uncharacterized protein
MAAVLTAASVTGCVTSASAGTPRSQGTEVRPIALIYRGPAACNGCAEAVANMLRRQPEHFVIEYIGPHERIHFSAAALRRATVYAQPGGNDDLVGTWRELMREPGFTPSLIPDFVRAGGRYLGTCMGGYLAGTTNGPGTGGFEMLPGDSEEYVGSPGADVHTLRNTLVHVTWLGGGRPQRRTMFFQDGPYFQINDMAGVTVLARYRNSGGPGRIAMMVMRYGKGVVAVSGPHPEATPDWYTGMQDEYYRDLDIGNALVAALMRH